VNLFTNPLAKTLRACQHYNGWDELFLGAGAFGFVFRATIEQTAIALKITVNQERVGGAVERLWNLKRKR
jgi:hypothetical protein